jgi:uncharacterized protein (DUF433 family)
MTATLATQIEIDDNGVARIAGTRQKVAHLILDHQYSGMTMEQIQADHPRLTMAQIHAAFTYYYEHQSEMDAWIEKDAQESDALAKCASDPVFRARLVALKEQFREKCS